MNSDLDQNTTQLLISWTNGHLDSHQGLSSTIYSELHKLARHYLSLEKTNHTLYPTELVHEVYLRLVDQSQVNWQNRAHFFGIAARLMRQILVDYARTRNAAKRQGNWIQVSFDQISEWYHQPTIDVLALHQALTQLEELNPKLCQIVELLFFGGLSNFEAAEVLGVTERTVQRQWKFVRAWLYKELKK